MKDVKTVAIAFSLLVVSIVGCVVFSHYQGDVSLEWGLSGGKVTMTGSKQK